MEQTPHKHAEQTMNFSLSPAKTFGLGIIGGIMTLCTIGFFILLGMYFNDGFPQGTKGTVTNPVAVANPTPAGNDIPEEINVQPVDEKVDHIKGPKNAKITIIEYSDFECPFCQKFHNETLKQVMANFSKDVRLVYRHFPLSFHPQAIPAALAAECANEQGKFWEMHDMLFDTGVVSTGSYTDYAKKIGLNTSKFDTCVKDQKFLARIQSDEQSGAASGVQGTPFSIIIGPDGQKVPISGAYPYATVEAQIKAMLQ